MDAAIGSHAAVWACTALHLVQLLLLFVMGLPPQQVLVKQLSYLMRPPDEACNEWQCISLHISVQSKACLL